MLISRVRDFNHDGVIFFAFYQNGVHLKKITNLGKSCQFGTTSYAQIDGIPLSSSLILMMMGAEA